MEMCIITEDIQRMYDSKRCVNNKNKEELNSFNDYSNINDAAPQNYRLDLVLNLF